MVAMEQRHFRDRAVTVFLSFCLGTGAACTEVTPADRIDPAAKAGGPEPSRTGSVAHLPAVPGPGGPAAVGNASEPRAPGSPVIPISRACTAMGVAKPGPNALRRLTRTEYGNTILDLLGLVSASATLPLDQLLAGFDNNASVARPSELLVEQYETMADRLATKAVVDLPTLTGCRPTDPASEDVCARQFVSTFGLRAFRRPLSKTEADSHFALYASMKAKYGHSGGFKVLLQAILQSPHFLYRVEIVDGQVNGTIVKAGPFEMATRLSYLIWSSMPDKILFDAASTGALVTSSDLSNQVRRMLDDPRAKQGINNFFGQWLDLSRLDRAQKDAATFPKWSPATAGLLRQESETFIQELVLRADGTLRNLLDAPFSYLNKDLASFYGVSGPTGATFQKVMLNPLQRAGLLTQGAFLASAAKPNQTAPVARGLHVRERLLCALAPPPPPGTNTTFPEPDGKSTTRERLAKHRISPSCAGCHSLIDPIGLAFEHYDAVGLWRDRDAGKPVDASGEVSGTVDADGKFDGAIELTSHLAKTKRTTECVSRQYFRFAFGRTEDDEADACTIETLAAAMHTGSIRQFIVQMTQTDPFFFRSVQTGAAP